MQKLLSTTALVVALGLPTLTLAQTSATTTAPATAQQRADMPGFLAMRGQSDIFVSDLMGHDVYARRTAADMSRTHGQAAVNADGTRDLVMMPRADLDAMDNIGQVNEIVLSSDGRVRALVIGVGGFLGMGEHDVAVTMDQVTFAVDPDDRSLMYIVVNTAADMLTDSPRYERSATMADAPPRADRSTTADRTAFAAPELTREGFNRVNATEVSTEMLTGKSVYDVTDNSVGTVQDLILDDAGAISQVIIDFGGFLGLGSTQVSIGFDELTILSNAGNTDVRIYVDATKEQIQALPQYRVGN